MKEEKEQEEREKREDAIAIVNCHVYLSWLVYECIYVAISRLTDHVKVRGHLRTERVCIYRKSEERKKWEWWESSMTCKHCLEGTSFCFLPISYRAVVTILFIKDMNEWMKRRSRRWRIGEEKRKRAKIDDDGSSSSRKRTRARCDATMMIDNRRRKRVKRCSGANLLLAMRSNETTYTHARDCFLISFFALSLLQTNGIMRACKRSWWDGVYVKKMKC